MGWFLFFLLWTFMLFVLLVFTPAGKATRRWINDILGKEVNIGSEANSSLQCYCVELETENRKLKKELDARVCVVEKYKEMKERFESNQDNLNGLRMTCVNLQNEKVELERQLQTLKDVIRKNEIQKTTPQDVKKVNSQNILTNEILYAYSASSKSPCGFVESDLMKQREMQPFVIRKHTIATAEFTLQEGNNQIKKQLLSSLTYYSNLIEYTNEIIGSISSFSIISPGKLTLKNGIWTIQEKIKIKLQ